LGIFRWEYVVINPGEWMREIVTWERIIKLANHISQCLLQYSTALQVLQCMLSIMQNFRV
jgi:hypothetical protein